MRNLLRERFFVHDARHLGRLAAETFRSLDATTLPLAARCLFASLEFSLFDLPQKALNNSVWQTSNSNYSKFH